MRGKTDGKRRRGQKRIRWLDGIADSMDRIWANSGRWWRTGKPDVLQFMELQRVGHDWTTTTNTHYKRNTKCYAWHRALIWTGWQWTELSQMLAIDARTCTWNSNTEAEMRKKNMGFATHSSWSRFMSLHSKLELQYHWIMCPLQSLLHDYSLI